MDRTEFSQGLPPKWAQWLHWPNWPNWIESLSKITDVPFLLFNEEKYIPQREDESRLCRLLQEQAAGRLFCEQDCTSPMVQALKKGETVYFNCYANLSSVAMPVYIDGSSQKKCLMLGGRLITSYDNLVAYRSIAEKMGCELDRVLEAIKGVQIKDLTNFKSAVEAVKSVNAYLFQDRDRYKALEDKNARLQTVINVASSISTMVSSRELYTTILDTLAVLFNARISFLLLRDIEESRFSVEEVFGYDRESLININSHWTDGLFGEAVTKNEAISSNKLFDILRSGLPNGFKSVNIFPITVKNSVEGLIVVLNTPVSRGDEELIKSFCKVISPAFELQFLNSRQKAIARKGNVLLEALRSISSHIDLQDICNVIVEKASEIVNAENGSLMLLGEDHPALAVKAVKGLDRAILDQIRISPGEGIAGRVLDSGTPMVVSDIEKDKRVSRPNRSRYKTKSFASLPLKIKDRSIGVLNLSDKRDGTGFSDNEMRLLEAMALYSAVAIERRIYYQSSISLRKISITDPVTELLNRRYFEERISEEMERSRRHKQPFSLIIMDLDDFKYLNDTHGHLAGDEALRSTGHVIRRCIRIIDIAARYGGEEFAVILPTTDKEDAQLIGHRIRDGIEQISLPLNKDEQIIKFTVSVGIATYPTDASTIEELINNADRALYRAKGLGKNQVVRFGDF